MRRIWGALLTALIVALMAVGFSVGSAGSAQAYEPSTNGCGAASGV